MGIVSNPPMDLSWKKMDNQRTVKEYLSPFEDEVLLITKSGTSGLYLVVKDSAYDGEGTSVSYKMTADSIKKRYGIEI